MINFFKLFKLFKKQNIVYPSIGSEWKLKDNTTWPIDDYPIVTVLDAHSGFVRYKIGNNHIFNDERLELRSFLYCYKEL